MSVKFKLILVCFYCIFWCSQVNAQALHWLSKPEVDIGPVANNTSSDVRISANGRYIAFKSKATNLVVGDNNNLEDIFIRDMQTGVTQLVSTTTSGFQASNGLFRDLSAPSSDGRYVAFISNASIFPGSISNTTLNYFLYVKDLQTGTLVNHSDFNNGNDLFNVGTPPIHLSDDGESVIFPSSNDVTPLYSIHNTQIFRKHLATDTFELLSVSHDGMETANFNVELAAVSDNGRYVLISTNSTNLTTDVINNSGDNFFINDTQANTMTLVNITPTGDSSFTSNSTTNEASISNEGHVVFVSAQSDLVNNDTNSRKDVFYYDNGTITRINLTANGNQLLSSDGYSTNVAISGDGSRIVFAEYSDEIMPLDSNDAYDLYSFETANGNLSLISQSPIGTKANSNSLHPDLSTNGNRIVFLSSASDLIYDTVVGGYENIFHYNFNSGLMKNETTAISTLETIVSDTKSHKTSSDQLSIIYSSSSPNIVVEPIGDNSLDLFLLDRTTNTHSKIASEVSYNSDISASGRFISFNSKYYPPDGSIDLGSFNVFLYDRTNQTYTQIEEGIDSQVNNNGIVVFSTVKGIDAQDTNSLVDAYVFNPNTQSVELLSQDMNGDATSIWNYNSFDIGGSGNNTWMTFSSYNPNIVINDTNGTYDVFMKKFPNGVVSRVTETIAGIEANSSSYIHSVSENGNWIIFITYANNLTADDYSNAYVTQVIVFDRINHQFQLASKNESGLPLTDAATSVLGGASISDSGRFVSYYYYDTPGSNGENFSGDTDNKNDVVLFDTVIQTGKIISKHINGFNSDDISITPYVVEDLQTSPPLVGVLFAASGGDLTQIANHPGFSEIFLYQQGGPSLTLTVNIQGSGTVVGTSAINCNDSCQYQFALGADLTLTALAGNGMEFVGWQVDFGECNNDTNPCGLLMDREKVLTAVFFDPSDVIFKNGFE